MFLTLHMMLHLVYIILEKHQSHLMQGVFMIMQFGEEWENGMEQMKRDKFISFSMIEVRVFILQELFLNRI